MEQWVIEQGDVVPQSLMAEDFGLLASRRGGHAQHLAHQGIVVGDVFQAIPVRVQTQAHDAQHQDCQRSMPVRPAACLPTSTAASSRPRISTRSVGCIQSH